MMDAEGKAVILLSGGLDSTTTLAIARSQGFVCYALTFDYGQRQAVELESARRVAAALGARQQLVLKVDLAAYGSSALTSTIEVPKRRARSEMAQAIPVTYVPARNTIFLAHALGWAEALGAFDIFIGANAVDYSGYPDCRPAFIAAFENLANLATCAATSGQHRFRVHAPLLALSKADIVRRGIALGVDFSLTHTCYDPQSGAACGTCDACQLRLEGFREAGVVDPIRYAHVEGALP
jgi:7-cyano-7-deazaguanine synthase